MPDGAADPSSAAEWLKRIKRVFNNGEFFRAYDLSEAALRAHPGDQHLAHRAVLSLLNAGAIDMAAAKFDELGLAAVDTVDVLSVRGRIAKDRTFGVAGPARAEALSEAAAHYDAAYRLALAKGSADAYYPAINAASLALLAGHEREARERAAEVLSLLGDRIQQARAGACDDGYWTLATAIEAYLLTDQVETAQALAGPAVAACGSNAAELSSTCRQLERILRAKNLDPGTLGAMAPAEIVHFLGHIIAPEDQPGRFAASEEVRVAEGIERLLDRIRIGAAYGALAAGADIMFAKALLRRGVALHVILPFDQDEFIELSVRRSGEKWVKRFEDCLAAAATVRYATEDSYLGDDQLFTYGSQIAMGLAVLYARHLDARLRQIAVWDGQGAGGVAGTAVDLATWRKAGLPQTIIRCGAREDNDPLDAKRHRAVSGRREARAMLFGDIKGFSKLTDAQLPAFTTALLGPVGQVQGQDRLGQYLGRRHLHRVRRRRRCGPLRARNTGGNLVHRPRVGRPADRSVPAGRRSPRAGV